MMAIMFKEAGVAENKRSKVAVVTGASSGIGEAIARRLSSAGYRTFGASRRAMAPEGVEAIHLDVTDDRSVAEGVAQIIARAGGIDLLVNNAGIALVAAIEESSIEQARAIFETNVFGAMRMTNAVMPGMRERGQGRVVNISSVVGFLPAPFSGLYAASKHALEGWSESLDHEVRTLGVRVSLVEPAFTASRIGENMPSPDRPLAAYEKGRAGMHALFSQALSGAPAPDAVAAIVLHAATTARPKVRYAVGREAATLRTLRRALPTTMFEKSFRKQFGLEAA